MVGVKSKNVRVRAIRGKKITQGIWLISRHTTMAWQCSLQFLINTRMSLIHPHHLDFSSCAKFSVVHRRWFIIYIIISANWNSLVVTWFLILCWYLFLFPPQQGQSAASATGQHTRSCREDSLSRWRILQKRHTPAVTVAWTQVFQLKVSPLNHCFHCKSLSGRD